ncbi:MAG: DUF3108 domain-containing protein [Deinococcus sp.]|nr:DUF3108 domain-containing protein [Deinococcus sp.]
MRPEELVYSLTYGGEPAGRQIIQSFLEGGRLVVRITAEFRGPLTQGREVRKVQTSYLDPRTNLPVRYTETLEVERSRRESQEYVFDRREGLLRQAVGRHRHTSPLVEDLYDPAATLHFLRSGLVPERIYYLWQLAGPVGVKVEKAVEVEGPWGKLLAYPMLITPGPEMVWIEADSDHRPLRFLRRIQVRLLEGVLQHTGRAVQRPRPEEPSPQRRRHRSPHPRPHRPRPSAGERAKTQLHVPQKEKE